MMFFSLLIMIGLFLFFLFSNMKDNENTNDKGFNTLLNFGVFLIILSSIIFATTTWKVWDNNFKVLFLSVETILFIFFGIILKYRFNINKTGSSLTFIGTILLGITTLSMGFFNIFGTYFSINGSGVYLFLTFTFLVEMIALTVRKLIIKSDKSTLILLMFLSIIYSFIMFLSNDITLAFSLVSVGVLIINLFKSKILNNQREFNIFNIVITSLLACIYFYSCVYSLIYKDNLAIQRLPLIIYLFSLSFNIFITIKNDIISILCPLCEFILLIWFMCFSNSLIISSLTIAISSILLYLIYNFNKVRPLQISCLIASYVQAIISIIMICFVRDLSFIAPVISVLYLLLTIFSYKKELSTLKIFNVVMQPIYLIIFAITVLVQPNIINYIRFIDVIVVINVAMMLGVIVSLFLKSNIKNIYSIMLMIGLFIQILFSSLYSINYSIISLVLNLAMLVYLYISKSNFNILCRIPASVLFILNIYIGLLDYALIQIISLFISLIIFIYLNKDNKNKYLYISMLYIPFALSIANYLPVNISISKDIRLVLFALAVILFTRNVFKPEDKTGMFIFEFFLFSSIALSIYNNIFDIVLLIILYIIYYLILKNDKNNLKTALTYLLFLTPALFFKVENITFGVLYMIAFIFIMIINQIIYRINFDTRPKWQEIAHLVITMILVSELACALSFDSIVLFAIEIMFLGILYKCYENKKVKYLTLSFVIFPLGILSNYIPDSRIRLIVNSLLFIIPIVVLSRKLFNFSEETSIILESVLIPMIFIPFIFIIDTWVAIVIGSASILLIIFGMKFKYNSLFYTGIGILSFNIIVQTFYLWNKLPWWVYLLIIGIIFVVIAAVKESKKD